MQSAHEEKEQILRFAQNDKSRLDDPTMTAFGNAAAPGLRNIGNGVKLRGGSVTDRRQNAALKTAALHKNLIQSLSRRG